ncbi:MAG: hypothetical protein ACOYCE_00675 [Limnochordia bacterium]
MAVLLLGAQVVQAATCISFSGVYAARETAVNVEERPEARANG